MIKNCKLTYSSDVGYNVVKTELHKKLDDLIFKVGVAPSDLLAVCADECAKLCAEIELKEFEESKTNTDLEIAEIRGKMAYLTFITRVYDKWQFIRGKIFDD